MNRKSLVWILSLLAFFVVFVTVFVRKAPDPKTQPADSNTTTEGSAPITTSTGGETTVTTSDDAPVDKEAYLATLESKLADLKASLEVYKNRTAGTAETTVTALEAALTSFESSVRQARGTEGVDWQLTRAQIDQQYNELLERFTTEMSSSPPPPVSEPEQPGVGEREDPSSQGESPPSRDELNPYEPDPSSPGAGPHEPPPAPPAPSEGEDSQIY